MSTGLLRTKSVEQSLRDTEEPEFRLNRVLGPIDLVVLGIGVTVGTGIFVLTGVVAATRAGPAVVVSFLLAGLVCALAALCYAEFASSVPAAGSAYTFTYASLGDCQPGSSVGTCYWNSRWPRRRCPSAALST